MSKVHKLNKSFKKDKRGDIMELSKEQIVSEVEYVALDTGEILFVNGYMLENRKDNKFFPLTMYFHRVVRIVKYRR